MYIFVSFRLHCCLVDSHRRWKDYMRTVFFTYCPANDDLGGYQISMEVHDQKGDPKVVHHGRTHLLEEQVTLLGARWKRFVEEILTTSVSIDQMLLCQAWFASNCLPETLSDRSIVEEARRILGRHLDPDTIRDIYQNAA